MLSAACMEAVEDDCGFLLDYQGYLHAEYHVSNISFITGISCPCGIIGNLFMNSNFKRQSVTFKKGHRACNKERHGVGIEWGGALIYRVYIRDNSAYIYAIIIACICDNLGGISGPILASLSHRRDRTFERALPCVSLYGLTLSGLPGYSRVIYTTVGNSSNLPPPFLLKLSSQPRM